MSSFTELQKTAHEIAKSRGWYTSEAENIPGKIALIHAEISEALEEYRDDRMELWWKPPYGGTPEGFLADGVGPTQAIDWELYKKPEGFGIELADTVIRIMDLAEYLEIDLENLIKIKMEYNKTRPFRHGGKRI